MQRLDENNRDRRIFAVKMFKSNYYSVLIGSLRLLRPSLRSSIVNLGTVRRRFSVPVVGAVRWSAVSARVGVAKDCLRDRRPVCTGNQLLTYRARKDSSRPPEEGSLSLSRGYYRQGAPVPAQDENSEDYGEWSETSDVPDEVLGDFKRFRISQNLVDKLKAAGIEFLFPVQTSTFDLIYDGCDVIVQARTGSGKTLSYAIPLVEKLRLASSSTSGRPPKLLVLTPTRELARQVSDVIESISDTSVACVYGGAPYGPQESKIHSGVDVIVGTPGRIQDFLEKRVLNLKSLSHVVLDEVDRMLDMGFMDSVDSILKERYISGNSSRNPQTLLFSATIPPWVQKTARKYLRPGLKKLDLVGKGTTRTATSVKHLAVECGSYNRTSIIADMIQVYSGDHGRSMVFCETKREADRLATSGAVKQESHVLHGDIPQDKREMVLKGFREGHYKCLIATDVAARGLDIPEVDLVIQCSPSKDVDSYIHRSGRTGRAGRDGISVLLYKRSEIQDLKSVEKEAGIQFKRVSVPTHSEVMMSVATDATKSLEKIPEETVQKFSEMAEAMIAERGAVSALAAALAVITGAVDNKPRSLLTSQTGYTTYVFNTASEMSSLGYVWRSLKQYLPFDVTKHIAGMRLCADKMGCVFDLPSNCDNLIRDLWKDGKYDTLKVASELPKILETSDSSTRTWSKDSRPTYHRHVGQYGQYAKTQSNMYGSRSKATYRSDGFSTNRRYRGLDSEES